MTPVSFFVPGQPVAQGRPRFTTWRVGEANRVKVYDPQKSVVWKDHVRRCAKEHACVLREGPLAMTLRFIMHRPANIKRGQRWHLKRPDVENLAKAVMDALAELVYEDDKQVVKLVATKEYGARPGVRVRVEEMRDGT